jgi:ribonuclease-3
MKYTDLQNLLGYRFKDISLLERALTHRSWAHENGGARGERSPSRDNESMEFVGDSVLGMAIAEHLFRMNPEMNEGSLTLMKHKLVSSATLAELAGKLRLNEFVRIGRGEELSGGRSKDNIAADTLESVIAAIFLDGGYEAAREFVTNLFIGELKDLTPGSSLDPKTTLQELLQADKRPAPSYQLIRSEGPPHDRTFFVEAVWDYGRASGTGRSLKAAEMNAAAAALVEITSAGVREGS